MFFFEMIFICLEEVIIHFHFNTDSSSLDVLLGSSQRPDQSVSRRTTWRSGLQNKVPPLIVEASKISLIPIIKYFGLLPRMGVGLGHCDQ